MLLAMEIENFAIIDNMRIEFKDGLNVLTGETGAGKSIVIDAVKLLLGGRASGELIRTGTDRAQVAGFFVNISVETTEILDSMGVTDEGDGSLLLQREISQNGKNICRVNGRQVTLSMYRQIGCKLIDIYGQHEHHSLMIQDKHLLVLDSFTGQSFKGLVSQLAAAYNAYATILKKIKELEDNQQDNLQKLDLWQFQLKEITQANPSDGESEKLLQERQLLSSSEKLSSGVLSAYQHLSGEQNSAREQVVAALNNLKKISHLDQALKNIQDNLETCLYQLEDAGQELRYYSEQIVYDPIRLATVENRLSVLGLLRRKYGKDEAELLEYREVLTANIEEISSLDTTLPKLKEQAKLLLQSYHTVAKEVTARRKVTAIKLEEEISRELAELEMGGTSFSVNFTYLDQPTAKGADQIEFLISPNQGEPLKALSKIASGGELSRIMLALKSILAQVDHIPTLIFDEIDTGIGGRAVEAVAIKLTQIGQNRQVICVTHAPQIAGKAKCHMHLYKENIHGRMCTRLKYLEDEERIDEIARMLAGNSVTATTIQQAKEIIKN